MFIHDAPFNTLSNLPRGHDWLPWLQNLFIPVPAQLPEEHTALLLFFQSTDNYSNTQAITVQPGTHSLLGWESAHAGQCPAQGYSATLQQQRPIPKTSQSKVIGHGHCAMMPCIYIVYITLDLGTLRVVNARELVIFGGSFTSHSKSVRRLLPCEWQEIQSPMLKDEKLVSTNCTQVGINPPPDH